MMKIKQSFPVRKVKKWLYKLCLTTVIVLLLANYKNMEQIISVKRKLQSITLQNCCTSNIRPMMEFKKLFTLSKKEQSEQNGHFKSIPEHISTSLILKKGKKMHLKLDKSINLKRANIQDKKKVITKTEQIKSCHGFDSYSSLKDLNESHKRKFKDWQLFEQNRIVKEVNCRLLIDNNKEEQRKAVELMRLPFKEESPHFYINKTKNCALYIKNTGYITSTLTEEEEHFPIAYSILVFKDIEQVETLLRAIYRPQNVYCIHCDTKADKDFKQAVHSIVGCFENVFISTESFNIAWGTLTVLLPELACMKDLWKYKKWKYFMNLAGQEFPLRTNYELVKILKIYKGANDMEGTVKRAPKSQWSHLPSAPHRIKPVKGNVHIVASRGFVEYVLHNKTVKDFFNWTKGANVPDEVFFASLNHNPHLGIQGSYSGIPETTCETKPYIARFVNWGDYIYNWPCHGKRVRQVCVFGIGDLPLLSSRQEMFANKFYLNYQPYTYKCMDEMIFNRTRNEYFDVLKFDTKMYQSLEFIKHTL